MYILAGLIAHGGTYTKNNGLISLGIASLIGVLLFGPYIAGQALAAFMPGWQAPMTLNLNFSIVGAYILALTASPAHLYLKKIAEHTKAMISQNQIMESQASVQILNGIDISLLPQKILCK